MKKIVSMLLAASIILTSTGALTACNKKKADTPSTTAPAVTTPAATTPAATTPEATTPTATPAPTTKEETTENTSEDNKSDLPETLSNFDASPIPNIQLTIWQLVGGMRDGVELDLGELAYYTTSDLTFFFNTDNVLNGSNGENYLDGTYEIISDGCGIHMLVDVIEYFGVFSEAHGIPTIITVDSRDPETLMYLQQLDER